jgi:phosphoenolpyruvate carboxykinase (ATP)
MYHFISGYTAKVAGTEMGVTEPTATFSACFGAAFLVWHPIKYAELLAEKINRYQTNVWLVNTGWTGGAYGTGRRMSLAHTRAIIDAIHGGQLAQQAVVRDPIFGLDIPNACPGIPAHILHPRQAWSSAEAYDQTASKLAALFRQNFKKFEDHCPNTILAAQPA